VGTTTYKTCYKLLIDHLGSASVTVKEHSGALTQYAELRYKPWGEDRPASEAFNETQSPSERRFTDQRAHDELGLYDYQARWYDPALGRFAQPDSIVPESQGVQAFDRYAYANNNPLRYSDPSGHSIWDTVGQFAAGFVYEFARTMAWYSPHAQNVLSVNATESNAMLAGRVAGDIVTIAVGVTEVAGGITMGTAGTTVSCAATLCTAAVVTVGAGAVVAGAGATTALAGAAGLGGNLALLTGDDSSSSGTNSFWDDWNAKKPYEGVVKNPDGTTTEYEVRQTPGRDGGWSRIVRVRDTNGNTISVTHEAWKGTSDPRYDPPDHTDFKPVNKR
jgi:RHS repeat-associated protein